MLKQHPLSAAFPAMSADDFSALVEDIKTNGQREPIMVLDGMVLDGWHRYSACEQLGIKAQTFTFPADKDPVAFVLSHNLHRRHLTASQRAEAAVACAQWVPRGRIAKDGNKWTPGVHLNEKGENRTPGVRFQTNADLAKVAGVHPTTIKDAKAAHKAGLGDAVKSGAMTVKEAAQVARGKDKPAKQATGKKADPRKAVEEPPPIDDFDPAEELAKAHTEIEKLTAEIQAAEAADLKAEAMKWRRSYDHAQRQQSEAMDRAKQATDREAWTMKQLRRCGKAVGVDDPKKIAAAVEAMAQERAAA